MGFALIFYGLNLMTGGLRPLRSIPEVMSIISSLRADDNVGLLYYIVIAAGITATIHSSSATIGMVMGLGAAVALFFPSMEVLTWAMGWFGGDPGVPVIQNGKEPSRWCR